MKKVNLGIIGTGGVANTYLRFIREGSANVEITALCDIDAEKVESLAKDFQCRAYTDYHKLIDDKICDAVVIATPHFLHTPIGIAALGAGLHVLVEKPISAQKADCQKLIAAHTDKTKVFGACFNQRVRPHFKAVKDVIDSGQLGDIIRVECIATHWFRTNNYYKSASWRTKWGGGGGGILINQAQHQLDLLQWFVGMPSKVTGFCKFGHTHDIEVEDTANAYFEYANGATGLFAVSTCEYPGTDRLEICGQFGKITIDNEEVVFLRNQQSVKEINESELPFTFKTKPEKVCINIQEEEFRQQWKHTLENFIEAILAGAELIAPAEQGINAVELANAIIYSSIKNKTVELPLDAAEYDRLLQELIKNSSQE